MKSHYYRSTSPPGGNQVDGLPPALRLFLNKTTWIFISVSNHTYYRSTSPPGGNQVDGLPPALRLDGFFN